MPLIHNFYLMRTEMEPHSLVMRHLVGTINMHDFVVDEVHIDDNMILYMFDTLRWIPTKNPAKKGLPAGEGLFYHGVTLFDKDSSYKLKSIFRSWRSLFENAPSIIEIPNTFAQEDEEPILKFNRDELLNQFDKMISFAEKIDKENSYLLTLGV